MLATLLIIQIFPPADSSVSTVAVCAGSGASVLTGVKADLYITGRSSEGHVHHQIISTIPSAVGARASQKLFISDHFNHSSGEMSHHEVLDAVAKGTSVILCDHSNSERGFLAVFQERLSVRLPDTVTVVVSKVDRDPLEVV